MPTVQNYGAQNYNPLMVQAIPGKNWMYGSFSLTADFIATFCHADLIVIFRGGPGTTNNITPAIPSGQMNLRMDVSCDQPGTSITLQEDLGDGVFIDITPAPVVCGAGLTRILIQLNGVFFRARVLRSFGVTTAMSWHAEFLGY